MEVFALLVFEVRALGWPGASGEKATAPTYLLQSRPGGRLGFLVSSSGAQMGTGWGPGWGLGIPTAFLLSLSSEAFKVLRESLRIRGTEGKVIPPSCLKR